MEEKLKAIEIVVSAYWKDQIEYRVYTSIRDLNMAITDFLVIARWEESEER